MKDKKKKNRLWSGAFKLKVVLDIIENELSYSQAARKYDMYLSSGSLNDTLPARWYNRQDLNYRCNPSPCNRSIVQPHPLIVQLVGFQYYVFSLIFCPENHQLLPKIIEISIKWPIFSVLSTKKP